MTHPGTTPTATDKPLLTLDHDVAAALSNGLGLHPMKFFFELDSVTEFLLHEIAHALSLGVEIRRYFDVTISERLARVCPLRADRRNEACVLAAEWIFYGYTKTRPLLAELRDAANGQQVPQRWLDRARKSRRALVLADQIARWALEHGVLAKTGAPTDLAFTDLRRRIRETPERPRSRA